MNLEQILRDSQLEYLILRDPALATVPTENLKIVVNARVDLGVAPLELVDCLRPLDFGELANSIRFILEQSSCGCPRKEMAALAAANSLDYVATIFGMHSSQRTIPPADCPGCPKPI